MTRDQQAALMKHLRAKCRGRRVRVEHRGQFRVRVTSGEKTILMSLDEDLPPKMWARQVAEQLYTRVVV